MNRAYDVTNVVASFLANDYQERPELMRIFREEVIHNRAVKQLLIEAGCAAIDHQLPPVQVLALGVAYGMALGVLLEKDRKLRERVL